MTLEYLLSTPPWEWPEDAHDTILETLRNPRAQEDERRLAAELAGDLVIMDDEMAEALLRILTDPDEPEELRGRSAIALGPALEEGDTEGPDPDPDYLAVSIPVLQKASRALRKVAEDADAPKLVRRMAMEAAVRWPEAWQDRVVRDAFRTGDPEWVMTSVFCMRWLGGFRDEVLEALDSDDPLILKEAIFAAGRQELDEAWPLMARFARAAGEGRTFLPDHPHAERDILFAVLETAPFIRPEETGDILIDLLDVGDEEIRTAVSEALEWANWTLEMDEEDWGEEEPGDDRVWH